MKLLLLACHTNDGRRNVPTGNVPAAVQLDRAGEPHALQAAVTYLTETGGPLTLEQVRRQPMMPVEADQIDFGHTDRVHWLRFSISNGVAAQQPVWVLRVMSLSSTVCDLYLVDPTGRVRQWPAGIRFSFAQRPFDALTFDFPLRLTDPRPYTAYLRLAGVNSQQYTLDLLPLPVAHRYAREFETIMALYFGAMLAMLIYNAFLFVSVRDRGYLLYTVYLLAMTATHLCMYGLGFKWLWPDNPDWAVRAQNVFTGLTIATAAAFANHFLAIPQRLPRLQWVLYSFIVVGLGISGLALLANSAQITQFVALSVVPVILVTWVAALLIWRRGYAPALFYVLGWLVLFVTIGLFSLKNLGIWAGATFVNFLMPIGTATEMLLFSFGLGYRINLSRREQAQLQQQRAEAEMRALRAQMNPHFVFNCLNTLDYYILSQQPDRASDFLQRFSQLIRNVLEQSRHESILLADELATLRLYIELEQERSRSRFTYQLDCDPTLSHVPIAPMLIQPFVENAILHGLRHKTDGTGQLTITCRHEAPHLLITIADNGIGRTAAAALHQPPTTNRRESLGMTVTAERLAALGAYLTVADGAPGTLVTLTIKLS
ncbi:7TM diverse intracellular signaling domain-containing protein [Fibrella aestuarina]|uniref:7TM diverse intracellular signaling domain-containing protein n=1 Tax=Fibrella aestuarina TaxID=651143 RepID=UPI00059C9106|nr:7TM diverse intracellular signaling domain-containing protein [Fibrella aestuarina]